MKEIIYTVKDPMGFHARPAGMLVKLSKEYSSEISVSKDGQMISAGRLFALMALGIKCGEEIKLIISGDDEEKAARDREEFLENNL